jgi:hypothetical protein
MICRLSLAQPQMQNREKCSTVAFPKIFMFRERADFSCYNVTPSLRTVAPPPCLPLYIKDLLKENVGRDGLIGWLLARMTLLLLLILLLPVVCL